MLTIESPAMCYQGAAVDTLYGTGSPPFQVFYTEAKSTPLVRSSPTSW